MPLRMIPSVYTVVSGTAGLILPRLEHINWAAYTSVMLCARILSVVGSGMMALTGIVFAIAFVMIQSGAVRSPPRVVVFASNPGPFQTLGIFFATFLAALNWTDLGGSDGAPVVLELLVGILPIVSMLAFSRLVQSSSDLQSPNVLRAIGTRGRTVTREMFPHF